MTENKIVTGLKQALEHAKGNNNNVRMTEKLVNPPLTINIHIVDIARDQEEKEIKYDLRKPRVCFIERKTGKEIWVAAHLTEKYNNKDFVRTKKKNIDEERAIDRKFKGIIDLIIWACNNGKELVFVNNSDDQK